LVYTPKNLTVSRLHARYRAERYTNVIGSFPPPIPAAAEHSSTPPVTMCLVCRVPTDTNDSNASPTFDHATPQHGPVTTKYHDRRSRVTRDLLHLASGNGMLWVADVCVLVSAPHSFHSRAIFFFFLFFVAFFFNTKQKNLAVNGRISSQFRAECRFIDVTEPNQESQACYVACGQIRCRRHAIRGPFPFHQFQQLLSSSNLRQLCFQ